MIEAFFHLVALVVARIVTGRWPQLPLTNHRHRPKYRDLVRQAKIRRRNRALQRWLKRGDRRGPLPNIGIVCARCGYSLTGLTGASCPECGETFDVEKMFTHSLVDEFEFDGRKTVEKWDSFSVYRVVLVLSVLIAIAALVLLTVLFGPLISL